MSTRKRARSPHEWAEPRVDPDPVACEACPEGCGQRFLQERRLVQHLAREHGERLAADYETADWFGLGQEVER